jgi:ATP-dependent Lon protease
MCRIAGVGAIVEHELMSDGRANIVVTGLHRIEMDELPFVPPYRRVRGKILADSTGSIAAPDRTALLAAAHSFVSEVHKRDSSFRFHLPANLEPGAIADLCAHHLVIDADARQAILEELDVPTRITRVTRELAMQQQILGRGESAGGRGESSGGGALN